MQGLKHGLRLIHRSSGAAGSLVLPTSYTKPLRAVGASAMFSSSIETKPSTDIVAEVHPFLHFLTY